MTRMVASIAGVGLLVSLVLAGSVFTGHTSGVIGITHAQEPREESSCTEATLNGRYGLQRNGASPGGAVTAVGHITFDGQGHAMGNQTTSRNGVFNVLDIMATYAVNADCTGTLTDRTGTLIAKFVITHGGSEVLGMSLMPGNNVAIHFERMFDPPGNAPVGAK